MAQSTSQAAADVPRWLIIVGSVAIGFHLTAITVGALLGEGPPWTMDGMPSPPPQFALSLDNVTGSYRRATKFTHNYHFLSNRPEIGIKFEVRLADKDGKELGTFQFPDKTANTWVHQRQLLLAQNLGNDPQVTPPQSEEIAAPNQGAQVEQIWEQGENRKLVIKSVPRHLVPRDHPVFQPSEWSMLVARSYVRYLCRLHGAASGEISRIHQDPIPPMVLSTDFQAGGVDDAMTSVFGEFKADNAVEVRRQSRPGRR